MELEEKIIEREEKYKGDFLVLERVKVELPDGNNAERDIVRHPGAVAIVAFKDDNTILMVEQFRVALNQKMLEIPAGKLEKNEKPIDCAQRELEEETGYKAKSLKHIGSIATGAGFTDEIIHIFKATELYKGEKGGDDDEFIDVSLYNIEDIKKLIKEGKIIDTKTISSFMFL